MDRGVRIAVASGVLLCGVLAALVFRRDPGDNRPAPQGVYDPLVLRERIDDSTTEPADRAVTPAGMSRPGVTVVTPEATRGAFPAMAPAPGARSPVDPAGATSRWGAPVGLPIPEGPSVSVQPSPATVARTHKIVDGDTLRSLAQRYLGDADRYLEIHQANRHLLPGPELLPIGVELTIPSTAVRRPSPPVDRADTLVPVPPRASRYQQR